MSDALLPIEPSSPGSSRAAPPPGPSPIPPTPESMPAESPPRSAPLDRRVLLGVAGIAGIAALAKMGRAGPLDPPPGPITPTGRTLGELYSLGGKIAQKVAATDFGISEPRIPLTSLPSSPDAQFVITQPGAYCMTGNVSQQAGMVCIDVQADDVDIDCQGFCFLGTSAGVSSSCVRSSGHKNFEIYDATFSAWQGCCIDCDDCDDVYVSDCIFRSCVCPANPATGSGGEVIRCRDRCEIAEVDVSQCTGCTVKTRDSSYMFEVTVTDSVGLAMRCNDGCCIDDCAVINGNAVIGEVCGVVCNIRTRINDLEARLCAGLVASTGSSCVLECCEVTGGSGGFCVCADDCYVTDCTVVQNDGHAITCGQRCCVSEVDVRMCTATAVTVGASSVIECCEVTGGSGGAYHCADGCCVEDATAVGNDGLAVDCGARCSITDNKSVLCWGMSCGAECEISDNEVSSSGGGGMGAIVVTGQRCCVSGNFVGAGGIVVVLDGSGSLIEDNHCVGAGGPPGTGGGMIAIAAGVTGCSLRSNHVRSGSISNAFVIPPGNSFGPLVNTIAGGDLSALPGGSHPHANFVS